LFARLGVEEQLLEDDRPTPDRGEQKPDDHELDDDVRVLEELEDREIDCDIGGHRGLAAGMSSKGSGLGPQDPGLAARPSVMTRGRISTVTGDRLPSRSASFRERM